MQSTEYVIWTNFHAKKVDRDVQAYQLAAMVLDRFGVHDGTILRYHQSHGYDETGSETFQNGLCMLEYDMLYGKHYATGGEMAVQPMELHFGVDEITLTGVSSSDGGLTVHRHELHAVQRHSGRRRARCRRSMSMRKRWSRRIRCSVRGRFWPLHRSPPRIRSGSSVRRRTGPSRRKNRK